MRRTGFLTAFAASLALAGCVENTTTGAASKAPGSVEPGSAAVDMVIAVSLYKRVCADTAPSFARATQELAALPVRQHPETGTYYHQNLNMSFKVSKGRGCSMVFASKDEPTMLALAFGSSLSSDGKVGVDPTTNSMSTKGPSGTRLNFITRESAGRGARYFAVSLSSGN